MPSPSVLVLLACCGSLAASAVRPRRSLPPSDAPPALSLEQVFSTCDGGDSSLDIGPCVEQLLAGFIGAAVPSFETGLKVGGRSIVLEPLSVEVIESELLDGQPVRAAVTDVRVAGLSTLQVRNVSLLPDRLAFNLSFSELHASGTAQVQVLAFTDRPRVEVTLTRPSVRLEAGWRLQAVNGTFGIAISDPQVSVDIQALSVRIKDLDGRLGKFLQTLIDNSHDTLVEVLESTLEDKAKRLVEQKFNTIKLAS